MTPFQIISSVRMGTHPRSHSKTPQEPWTPAGPQNPLVTNSAPQSRARARLHVKPPRLERHPATKQRIAISGNLECTSPHIILPRVNGIHVQGCTAEIHVISRLCVSKEVIRTRILTRTANRKRWRENWHSACQHSVCQHSTHSECEEKTALRVRTFLWTEQWLPPG